MLELGEDECGPDYVGGRSGAGSDPQSTDELGMLSGAVTRKVPCELG